MPAADRAPGWWHCAALRPDGSTAWYAIVPTGRFEDGQLLELPEDQAAGVLDEAECVARLDGDVVVSLDHLDRVSPDAPPLWFAELPEPDADPVATNLVAFSGHDVPVGAVLDRERLWATGVRTADQLAAVRWWPATGEIDQVYVNPKHRRTGIATALLLGFGTLQRARGGPRVWSDGQRTALGERLRNGGPWVHLAAEQTHLAPPMTPFEDR